MLTTKKQVEIAIAKGTNDEVVQSHIDYIEKKWKEGVSGEDLNLQYSYDIVCDNS